MIIDNTLNLKYFILEKALLDLFQSFLYIHKLITITLDVAIDSSKSV